MASINPVLFAQFQQFMAFTEFQKLREGSAVQNNPISSHPTLPTAKLQAIPSVTYVKPFEPAKHQNPETIPNVNNNTSYNAEANDSNVAGSSSAYMGNYVGEDWEAKTVGWRRNLKFRLESTGTGNNKRTPKTSRQFVIKACIERGISLDQRFDSYGAEKMDATIDSITELAADRPGWDRELTRDIIRSLCSDGVRSRYDMEKRKREALQGDSDHEVKRTMMGKGKKHVTGANATTIALTGHDYLTQNYGSKTIASGLSSKALGIHDKNTVLTTEEIVPNVPTDLRLSAPLFRVDFRSPTRQITLYFPQNISYTSFNETVFGTHVRLAPGETLQYKARRGTHKDRQFKPLMMEEDFISMVKMYMDNGVTLYVLNTTELSDPAKHSSPLRDTTATRMSSTPPPGLSSSVTDNISPSIPDSKSSRKAARKSEKIKNHDKKGPSHKKHGKVGSRTAKAEREAESPKSTLKPNQEGR